MGDSARLARTAVVWTVAFNLYRDILQFGTMLVLVRLIEPAAYGQFAQTTAIVGFVAVFSFNNFVAHTLQPRAIANADYQVHFTAGAMFQGAAFLCANLVAFGAAASGTIYAAIAGPIHIASIGFLLEWPCELRRRMLERDYRWRRLNVLHAIGILMSTVVGLAMALEGFGVYALIAPGMLQTVPFIWDLFVAEGWRPDWSWSRRRYAAAWTFGLKRTGSALAIAGRGALESMVLAGILGYQLLGIFNRALGLVQLLCGKPASILGTAIYPMLPRLALESATRSNAGDLLLRTVGWSAIPMAGVSALLAEPIVTALYGERWLGVIPLLPWAMAYGAAFAVVQTANLLLVAGQRVGTGFLVDLYLLASTALGLWLALSGGVVAYLGFLLGALVILLLLLSWALGRLRLASPMGLAYAMGAPVLASAGATAIAWAVMPPFAYTTVLHAVGYAVATVAVFMVAYVAVIRVGFRRPLRELLLHLPGKRAVGRLLAIRDIP